MKLVLAEKPSVAQSIAKVLGAAKREDGYLEGNGYVVSWCVGHLVELAQPEVYDAKYSKWAYADLPIFPMDWQYEVSAGTKKQFGILKKLMAREDVASLVCATDAGREGELIFRLVYHKAGCRKPFERLWISSIYHFRSPEIEVGESMLAAKGISFFPYPSRYAVRYEGDSPYTAMEFAKQIKKHSLAELLSMQLLPYEILEIDDGIRPYCFLVERLGHVRCIRFKSDIARENKYEEPDNKAI